jgi:hypothetical protein
MSDATFFIPHIDDGALAESTWTAVRQFMVDQGWTGVRDVRIFRLEYRHDGREMEAQVGESHPYGHPFTWDFVPDYDDPNAGEYVVAIFETEDGPFLVCTHSRGVVRGEPILVGSARRVVYFDGYAPDDVAGAR